MPSVYLTIQQAAAAIGCSEKTVRRLVKAGTLPAERVDTPTGFVYRLAPEAVDKERAARAAVAIVPVPQADALAGLVDTLTDLRGALGHDLAELGSKVDSGQAAVQSVVQAAVQAGLADIVAQLGNADECSRLAQELTAERARADALQAENAALRAALVRPLTMRERMTGRREP